MSRRPQLRTRVLAGVLLVTLTALVAFDVAAVTALRKYLISATDTKLGSVLSLYRPFPGTRVRPSNGRIHPSFTVVQGPHVRTKVPIFDQYYLKFVSNYGPGTVLVAGNPGLRPRPAWLKHRPFQVPVSRTVVSEKGHAELRLRTVRLGRGFLVITTSLANVNQTVDRLKLILAIGSLAAGLLAALGVALVVRRGLRPIETMAAQADRISAGDLTDRVTATDHSTEVGRLGAALNGMLGRIEASVREREASQEVTRRFFADASHELRNPLASLRANAELYQQGALTRRADVDEAIRRIALESQRMSAIVDDMLRLARLDQHPDQKREPVDLTALVTSAAENAQVADQARRWRVAVEPGLLVTGDEELLRRAVGNLLANVTAHTPAGTTAELAARREDGAVVIEVSDDGPGVPADRLPRIFDRFYRAGSEPRQSGSGLGLAIVTAIAEGHGGIAQAEPAESHGLRVTLALPASPPPVSQCANPASVGAFGHERGRAESGVRGPGDRDDISGRAARPGA